MAKAVKKQFVIIGLGRFGTALTKALYEENADVLVIDEDQEKVNLISEFCTQAVCADATDERVMERLGINNFDVAVVCTASDIESSIFVTLLCKQMGIKHVIAQAQNDKHSQVLKKVGADRVIVPEEEMGEKLAASLTQPYMIELASFSEAFRIVEIMTPVKWQNKTLIQLDLRATERVSIVLIKRGEEIISTPTADCVLLEGDILVIAGATDDTERLSRKATQAVITE